eukprot:CAMPEP_0117610142 /NCGR_PEP_ID=MMETSP0784-20121206/81721_1 /TAXON_ID=39447 /ORGANISM="" /LENGTH=71 /DNA_ID=CAMNT_0005413537 /DNA_START=577 /DNA_END=791 /DNA_ORIENTATION=-
MRTICAPREINGPPGLCVGVELIPWRANAMVDQRFHPPGLRKILHSTGAWSSVGPQKELDRDKARKDEGHG